MKTYNLLKHSAVMLIAVLAASGLSSCRHKDLSYEPYRNSLLNVVFDWRNAPDADPSAMAFYLYSTDGTDPIRFIFQNKTGGSIKVPSGDYHSICLNADLNDWAVISSEKFIDTYEVSTPDANSLTAAGYSTRAIPRAPESGDERYAATPGMLWAYRLDNVALPASYDEKTIVMYPEEKVCHYTVDVYDSGDVSNYPNGVDATLSGMAEGYLIGKDRGSDTKVTHPFVLEPVTSDNSLHAEFLTFGETPGDKTHYLSMYLTTAEGKNWNCNIDVSKVVHEAPDPRHVHIVIRGIDLPDPPSSDTPIGGIVPDVDDWQSVYIDLKM